MKKKSHPGFYSTKSNAVKLLTIIIPVYNEEQNIEKVLEMLNAVSWPIKTEWVIVDDGSTDNSLAIIRQNLAKYKLARLVILKKNVGKAAAICKGIEAAMGQIIVIQDADLEYNPNEIVALISPIRNGEADVVYGSRYLDSKRSLSFHTLANKFLTSLSNLGSGMKLTDMETCYKVFSAPLLKSFRIRTKRFGFEPEITSYIAKFNIRIKELPVSYSPRNYAEGKKIGWKDGVAALWFIFKFNFLVSAESCLKIQEEKKKSKQAIAS